MDKISDIKLGTIWKGQKCTHLTWKIVITGFPLLHIINTPFETEAIPDDMQISTFIPIPKKIEETNSAH